MILKFRLSVRFFRFKIKKNKSFTFIASAIVLNIIVVNIVYSKPGDVTIHQILY